MKVGLYVLIGFFLIFLFYHLTLIVCQEDTGSLVAAVHWLLLYQVCLYSLTQYSVSIKVHSC